MTFNPIRPVPGQDATEVANQISRAIGREPGGGGESEFFRNVDYARIQTMTEIFMALDVTRLMSAVDPVRPTTITTT